MKNIVIKALIATLTLGVSACTTDSANYPSLVGSDSQENVYANNSNIVNGSYTGTFVGQRVATFRQELKQLSQAQKSNQKELDKINSNISKNARLYQKTIFTKRPFLLYKTNYRLAPLRATRTCTLCCNKLRAMFKTCLQTPTRLKTYPARPLQI